MIEYLGSVIVACPKCSCHSQVAMISRQHLIAKVGRKRVDPIKGSEQVVLYCAECLHRFKDSDLDAILKASEGKTGNEKPAKGGP